MKTGVIKREAATPSDTHLSSALEITTWALETPRNEWFNTLAQRNARRLVDEFNRRVHARDGGTAREFGRVL